MGKEYQEAGFLDLTVKYSGFLDPFVEKRIKGPGQMMRIRQQRVTRCQKTINLSQIILKIPRT